MQSITMLHTLRIPEDIALVGCDDIDFAASAVVALTSIRQPAALIGRTAVELLAEQLGNPGTAPRSVVFKPELAVRASTGGQDRPSPPPPSGGARSGRTIRIFEPELAGSFIRFDIPARHGIPEKFMDTPTRDKGRFPGGAVNISCAAMSLLGDRAHTRTAPLEYYRQSGDAALPGELHPQLRDTAEFVLRHLPQEGPTTGLVTDWGGGSGPCLHGMVDQPAPGRFGRDMGTQPRTAVNAQSHGCSTAWPGCPGCPPVGRGATGTRRRGLAAAINARLRDGGCFIDALHADGSPSTRAPSHATSFPCRWA